MRRREVSPRQVFLAALRVRPEWREEFVRSVCRERAGLEPEVRSLLRAHREGDSFLRPPTALDARFEEPPDGAASPGPLAPEPCGVAPGTLLGGRYRLGPRLDEGGSGTVFDATDDLTRARVAVKVVRAADAVDLARVRREIGTLRWLRLPGVVPLLDDGVEGTVAWLAMELVRGRPFPGLGTPAPWDGMRRPAVALLETVARIHWAGVVHGDLKPANVLIGEDGLPVVLDLGLSTGPEVGRAPDLEGVLAGTPRYMAPELIRGAVPSVASDLYAVGVMLYEALAGRPPHAGSTVRASFAARLAGPPPALGQVRPEVPRAVAYLVDRLLQTDPGARPPAARAALALLQQPLTEVAGDGEIPWLGARAVVQALETAARSGRSVDIWGPAGSGRTRCLAEAAAALESEGRRLLRLGPGSRPFESLGPALGDPEALPAETAEQAQRAMEWSLSARLAGGEIVVADDAERLDRFSARALEACLGAGTVWRAWRTARPGAVPIPPIPEPALQALFAGTNRVHHVPEDAARELFARTRGLPARVASEISAWERARLARREGSRWVVTRDAVERLRSGLWVSAQGSSLRDGDHPLDPALDDVRVALDLAGSRATLDMLACALERPRWLVEADVDDLVRQGVVRAEPDGRLVPVTPSHGGAAWPPERRAAVHRALASAFGPGASECVYHLLAAGNLAEVPGAALLASRARLVEGAADRATSLASEGLRALRGLEQPALHGALLAQAVACALGAGTVPALDLALHHVQRSPAGTPGASDAERILRAALLAVRGDGERALALLGEGTGALGTDLERGRWSVRVAAARLLPLDREREEVAAAARAVSGRADLSEALVLDEWMGWLRYREGRFREAASFHERAARAGAGSSGAALSAMLNAASAFLEAHALLDAARLGAEALASAQAMRHTLHEARAERVLRAVAYRRGDALVPDLELAEAVAEVGQPNVEGLVLLNEAAVAWRTGDLATSRRLAARAAEVWGGSVHGLPTLLARALAAACGAPWGPDDTRTALRIVQESPGLPRLGLQVLALLTRADPDRATPLRAAAREPAAALSDEERPHRREVLSLGEALAMLSSTEFAADEGGSSGGAQAPLPPESPS